MLRHYSTMMEVVAMLLRYVAAHSCKNNFFFLMTPSRFKSLQPPPLRMRKREKENKKKKKRALKLVLVSFFPVPQLSSDPNVVGW